MLTLSHCVVLTYQQGANNKLLSLRFTIHSPLCCPCIHTLVVLAQGTSDKVGEGSVFEAYEDIRTESPFQICLICELPPCLYFVRFVNLLRLSFCCQPLALFSNPHFQ